MKYPTRGIVINRAYSAAFLILQCCTERIAGKDAKLILHFPRFADQKKVFSHLRVFHDFLTFLSGNTGHSIRFLWQQATLDRKMSAQDALALRFIDRILS